jgi:hypothetical protein
MERKQLEQLHILTEQVERQQELASELLRTAQDRHNHEVHKLMRDGAEIELQEKVLWDETFYLGKDCEAGKLLASLHPEVFEAYIKQDDYALELKKFCIMELGVDYSKLSLSDYLRLTEALIDLKISEKNHD